MNKPVNDMPTPVCGSTNRLDKAKRVKKIYQSSGKCTGWLVIVEIKVTTNAQSICGNALKTRQKRTAIVDFIADHDVDIMIVSETWLRESGDESKCADLRPPGYKLYNFPRKLGTTA